MKRAPSLLLMFLVAGLLSPTEAWAGPTAARFGVGDSIMRSADDELGAFGWRTNAEVGRQFSAGATLIVRKAARGTLPTRMIVHLGTNGPIDPDDCATVVDAAAKGRRLFLVTVRVPRGWQDDNNEILRACAASSRRVHVIRWFAHSDRHDEWYADDGYHLNADGQAAYATYLEARVDAILEAVRARRGR